MQRRALATGVLHEATVKYLVGGGGPGDARPAVKFAQHSELDPLGFKPPVSVWTFKHLGAAEWLGPSRQEHGGVVCGIAFLVGLAQEYGVSVALGQLDLESHVHILQIPVFHVVLEVGGCVSMLLVAFEVFHALHVVEAFAVELAHARADIIFRMFVGCTHLLGGDA